MRYSILTMVFVAVLHPLSAQEKPKWAPSPHVAATEPLRPEEQQKKFKLPPGFEIQLVAGDPDIRKPLNIAFDAAGRLWVTETIEYPFPAEGRPGRDAVKVLEDFGPDGRARKITTFAGGLNIPIGILPLDKRTCLVHSIPSIWRMTDTDGDGKADKREELLTGFGSRDTHGMTSGFQMGFDGWVYACHGFANTSVVKGRDGSTITMHSGNTYRFKPDGTRVEFFTHGQVNPFGLTFDRFGNLYSTDCHTRPLYQLLRGAYYPSFGKPHDGLGFGPEMVTHDHGSTAIGGIACYEADQYPPEFRGNLFVGNVVTNRINRDRIEWRGSTPKGIEMPDLVRSDDPWFRPVDIKLGPDGCLYVADFYNRIIGHYEVPLNHPGRDRDKGRIWRIVYRGTDGKSGPKPVRDLARASAAALVEDLNDPNLTVRLHATHQLDRHTLEDAVSAILRVVVLGSDYQKAHGLWALQRRGRLDDLGFPKSVYDYRNDPLVLAHFARVLAEDPKLSQGAHAGFLARSTTNAHARRAALEALGIHPDWHRATFLLEMRHEIPAADTHMIHVTRMTLRNLFRLDETWAKLPRAELKENDYRAIADVCPGVHTEAAAEFLKEHLVKLNESGEMVKRYCHHIVRHGKNGATAWIVDFARRKYATDMLMQGQLLKAVQQGCQERGIALGKAERAWGEEVVDRLLLSSKNAEAQLGIELAGALKLAGTHTVLLSRALDRKQPEAQRKNAVATLVSLAPGKSLQPLLKLCLAETESIGFREQVAVALAGSSDADSIAAMVKALETTPARLQAAIALGLAGSRQGGDKLLAAVEAGKASPRLLQERLIAARLQQAKIEKLDQRLARLTKNLPPADQRLQELLARRRDGFAAARGDVAVGQKIFAKSCGVCHQVSNQGAKIGPQLDGIGIRGLDRILEDVLDPNRNVDQAFRSTLLVLDSGQIVNGLVLREEGEVIVLADAQGKEVRVPKSSVQERQVSALSPMPSNIGEQMGALEMDHLLAFLLAQQVKN